MSRRGGFPYSHITLSQNVNIFVKTKNAQEALKHKINLKIFFVTWAFPYWGGGGGVWQRGKNSHVLSFFVLEDLPNPASSLWITMVGICWWQNPTMAINDKFPPWWDFVMVGICRKAIIIIIPIITIVTIIAKLCIREAPWNDKCCSNGFLPRGWGCWKPCPNGLGQLFSKYKPLLRH